MDDHRDFDHHSPEYARTWVELSRRLRREAPVTHSDHYDGYWIVTRYEDVVRVGRDHETFASNKSWDADGCPHGGISIPSGSLHLIPDETDPPEWNGYRRLLNPRFAPVAVERIRPALAAYTTEMIDRVIETGRFDIVLDLANPVTALITLEMLGVPTDEWRRWAEPFHVAAYGGSDDHPNLDEEFVWVATQLAAYVAERRTERRDDLLSYLIDAEIDGEALTDELIVAIAMQVLGGGVDTTTALVSNTLMYLDDDRATRQRLIDSPALFVSAREEFLRAFTPVHALARTVTKEVELGGQQLSPGDRVLISFGSANRDETEFDEPDDVELGRFPNRHLGFGIGIHRCLGSNLARATFQSMIEQVLERMPDYAITRDQAQRYPSIAVINGWVQMPATFSPGKRIGPGLPLPA